LSRDDGVVVDVLCLTVDQIEFKAAPPTSGTFSMLALPFALLDCFNVFLLMFPDSIAVLEMPTTPPAPKKIHWRELFLNQWTSLSPVHPLLEYTVNFCEGRFQHNLVLKTC
jgi:hypothetical protein